MSGARCDGPRMSPIPDLARPWCADSALGSLAFVRDDLEPQVLTPDEAGVLLRLTRQAIYRRIRRSKLPAVKDGRRWLIPRAAVDAILRGRREAADEQESDRGPRGKAPRVRDINPCREKQDWFSIVDRPIGKARWEVNFYVYRGRSRATRIRRRSPYAGRGDTQRWAHEMLPILGSPPESKQTPATPTLEQACERWLATQPTDRANKTRHLAWLCTAWGAETMIDTLDHERITGLPARLGQPAGATANVASRKRRGHGNGRRKRKGEGLGDATIRAICQTANRVLEFAQQMGWRQNAQTKVPLPKIAITDSEWLTVAELESVLAAAEEYRLAFALGARAGLRRGEILELRWKDVDLENSRIRVTRAYKRLDDHTWTVGPPKGGRNRTVRIPRDLLEALQAAAGQPQALVVQDEHGKRLEPWRLTSAVGRVATQVGIDRPGIGAHTLRHSYCSHLAQGGASTKAIQMVAGHASMKTTERYMHLSPAHVEAAIAHLPALGSVEAPRKHAARRPGSPTLRLVPTS